MSSAGDHARNVARETRDALPLMFSGRIGARDQSGAVRVKWWEFQGMILYGPYWRLPEGGHRLKIACNASGVRHRDQPCLAVEIVAQNRFLCAAQDFAPRDLEGGPVEIPFVVTPERSETGEGLMFDFRLRYLGGVSLSVEGVSTDLNIGDDVRPPFRWRLLPRLRLTPFARRTSDGGIASRCPFGRFGLVWFTLPRLKLPSGQYALALECGPVAQGASRRSIARVRLRTELDELLLRDVSPSDIDENGRASIPFRVATHQSMEGAPELNILFSIRGGSASGIEIRSAEIAPFEGPIADPAPVAPAILKAKAKIVIVGNCQAEELCSGLKNTWTPHRFRAIYHSAKLMPSLREQGRRDLVGCDYVLAQKISEWDDYPLRADIPNCAEIIHFPVLRLASPWPFDGYNGPTDQLAADRDGENQMFRSLDAQLARLRVEVPEPEERFRAYAILEAAQIAYVERLARFEARRLEAMDKEFGCDIGAYINSRFRDARLFHTTAHPNGRLLARLMLWIAGRIGDKWMVPRIGALDGMGDSQVPVHPEIGRVLGIKWATKAAVYRLRGRKLSWEQYVRSYIAHYG